MAIDEPILAFTEAPVAAISHDRTDGAPAGRSEAMLGRENALKSKRIARTARRRAKRTRTSTGRNRTGRRPIESSAAGVPSVSDVDVTLTESQTAGTLSREANQGKTPQPKPGRSRQNYSTLKEIPQELVVNIVVVLHLGSFHKGSQQP